MITLENKLLHTYKRNNFENLEKIFDDLFRKLINSYKDKSKKCRNIKNYLISLNSCIYSILYTRPICKTNLYKARFHYNNKIETASNLKSLKDAAYKMIIYYKDIDLIQSKSCTHPAIRDAVDYIHNNLDRDISLRQVASQVNVSTNYLSYLFSEYLDSSFSDYINKLRIEKAKSLLRETNMSILDVSLDCGFSSQSYFCFVFKKFEGVTPKKYQHGLIKELL